MPLTNATANAVRENLVTDAPVASQPRAVLSTEAAIMFDKGLVARPLMVPEVAELNVKNNEYRYRWVNRLSQNGRYYMQRKAQGFTNATLADVEPLGNDLVANESEIVAGDLILMKIQTERYDAAIKYNMEKAQTLTRARGMYLKDASSDVNSDSKPQRVSVANEPFSRSGLATPFIPTNADAIVDESESSGRVEETRRVVDGLRQSD